MVDLRTYSWIMGGKHRQKILSILYQNPLLPSEIASKLQISRSMVSRELNLMKQKNLVESFKSDSKTVVYVLTEKGVEFYIYLLNKST